MAGLGKIKHGCDAAQCDLHLLRGAVSRVPEKQQGSISLSPGERRMGFYQWRLRTHSRRRSNHYTTPPIGSDRAA